MDVRSIEDVKQANFKKMSERNERETNIIQIFYLIVISIFIIELYWRFYESPLIVATFIGFLLFFFYVTVPFVSRFTKYRISSFLTVSLVVTLSAVTYFITTFFLE